MDAALKANPYNMAAYGLLVFVLMVFSFQFYRDKRRVEKQHMKDMRTMVTLMVEVESNLEVLRDVRRIIADCPERYTHPQPTDISDD